MGGIEMSSKRFLEIASLCPQWQGERVAMTEGVIPLVPPSVSSVFFCLTLFLSVLFCLTLFLTVFPLPFQRRTSFRITCFRGDGTLFFILTRSGSLLMESFLFVRSRVPKEYLYFSPPAPKS